jgi:succinylglutamic semialdehyde dehydrogenase
MTSAFSNRGNYINGSFKNPREIPSSVSGEWVAKSPADFSDEIGKFQYSYASVDEAVRAARAAAQGWRETPQSARIALLEKVWASIAKRADEALTLLSRETGKPHWESRQEVAATLTLIDVTVREGLKGVEDFTSSDGVCRRRPIGVMAVIGPFNLPVQLPASHWVPALVTGNTVVFKPSEKAPAIAQLITECIAEAGFPKGVFNLVQGEREVGRRLSVHEAVDGVLFTGSYETGTRIKQDTLQQHWKLLALEMGGKNSSIVWEDADFDLAIHEALVGGYVTAGQRCTSTTRVIVHQSRFERFVDELHERAKKFPIGHPSENPFMGPLIEPSAVDRYMKFLGIAAREGCELVMRGKALELKQTGNYVTPTIAVVHDASLEGARKSVFQQTEFFSPALTILGVKDLEEAILLANTSQYGMVASVFTANRAIYDKCRENLQYGWINWNRATTRTSPTLPLLGLKKSGNHFATGVAAALYCTTPVSSLESETIDRASIDAESGLLVRH